MEIILKHKVKLLILIYLVVWIICGLVYWGMANISKGDMFQFQEDILLKSKVHSFEKENNININDDLVKPLFQNYDGGYLFGMTTGNYPVLRYAFDENGAKPVGMDWMRYYYAQWSQEGYNFYKCEYVEDINIYVLKEVQVIKLTVCSIPESSYNRIAPSQYLTLPTDYENEIVNYREYYISLDEALLEKFDYNKFYPLYEDLYFLSNSYNYIDNSHLVIDKYEKQDGYIYPLIDFLYFSAVTITTLGYGDILPNSTGVRVVVMVETLLGMISIALIAASIYDNLKKMRSN